MDGAANEFNRLQRGVAELGGTLSSKGAAGQVENSQRGLPRRPFGATGDMGILVGVGIYFKSRSSRWNSSDWIRILCAASRSLSTASGGREKEVGSRPR